MVVRGRLGMHTSPAYAEDVYVGALTGLEIDGHPAGFIVPVGAAGRHDAVPQDRGARREPVRLAARPAAMTSSTARCGSTTCSIPWERVFAVDPAPEAIPRWLRWHHLYGWLAKAEFTLGLALALTDAMGLKEHDATVEYLVDLIAEVQTVRSCIAAAERDPEFTPTGYCVPNHAPSRRRRHRAVQGAPADLRDPAHRARLVAGRRADRQRSRHRPNWRRGSRRSFGGGGYTARAARGAAAAGLRTMCRRRSTAASRRSSCMPAAACPAGAHWLRRSFQRLQRAGQCGAERDRPADAGDRCRQHPGTRRCAAARRPVDACPTTESEADGRRWHDSRDHRRRDRRGLSRGRTRRARLPNCACTISTTAASPRSARAAGSMSKRRQRLCRDRAGHDRPRRRGRWRRRDRGLHRRHVSGRRRRAASRRCCATARSFC